MRIWSLLCLSLGLVSCARTWNASKTQNQDAPHPGNGEALASTHMICGSQGVLKRKVTEIPPGVGSPIAYLSERGIPVFELFDDATNPQPRGYVEAGEPVTARNVHANGLSKIHFSRPRPGDYWVRTQALCPLPPAPTHVICGTDGVVKEEVTPIPPGITNPVAYLSERGIPVFELFDDATNPQPRGYVEGGELVAATNVHSNGLSKIHFARPRPGEYWVRTNALCRLP